jgi:NAD(P)-dependent dehydrogenase (short-subunit alcohol dehydrogenase family)
VKGRVLVTGGARRLGAEICRTLASEGYEVVVHYRTSEDEAKAVAKECAKLAGKADLIQGNFSTKASTLRFLQDYRKRFDETTALVNNVGNYAVEGILETASAVWYDLFQTNLHVPYALTRGLLDQLTASRGSVVNIGISGLGPRAYRYSGGYMIAKESLLALTRALAVELAGDGINVNMVSPGVLDNAVDHSEQLIRRIPMQRAGSCQEVAQTVAFFIKPENRYITGQNLEVAGGCRL